MSVHRPLTVRLLPWWLRCLGWALSSEFPSLRMFYLMQRQGGLCRRASAVWAWHMYRISWPWPLPR